MSKKDNKEVEAPVIEAIAEVPASNDKKAFKALMEAYREANPVKYELKEDSLKAQLASLK